MSSRWLLLSFMSGLLTNSMQGQMRVDLKAAVPFVLKVNGHVMNVHPVHRLGFDWETKDKKFQLTTMLTDGDSIVQSLNYKSGFNQDFELQQVKNTWKWQLIGENTWVLDSTQSSVVVSLDPIYLGSKNCQSPMHEDQWSVFYSEIRSNPMSAQKLRTIAMLSKGTCCTVEQWGKVFGEFELEDDKLALLDLIKGSIYDWDHRLNLMNQFLIERNRNKAVQLLSQ
jgi:hypothetical protein